MRLLLALSFVWICAACGVAPQPRSNETVAAFEVPLSTARDRAAFIAILSEAAKTEGGHVDSTSEEELREAAAAIPAAGMSIHLGVWRGQEDEENWAVAMDQADHIGQVWIMFARGQDEVKASRFRERAMKAIRQEWPETLSLPIIDKRTIPLRRDLVRTPTGYKIDPAAASEYDGAPRPAN